MKKPIIMLIVLLIVIILIGFIFYFKKNSARKISEVNFDSTNTNSKPKISPNNNNNAIIRTKLTKHQILQKQADSLLILFDKIPSVPVYLTDEAILKQGNNVERGLAYTKCIESGDPKIFIKDQFYKTKNQKQITNILKHELTHAWQCHHGIMTGHDNEFREKFKSVGGFGN